MIRRTTTSSPPVPGVIDSGAAYTLAEFGRRCQLGERGLRSLRRKGLRVVRVAGGRGFVLGRDFIALLDRIASQEER